MKRRRIAPCAFALGGVMALLAPATPADAAADPAAGMQWGMARVGAPQAWAKSTGKGVTVAIVDTGIDLHHEDLASDRLVVLPGANFITPGQLPQDDQGHGTHVAGIVGATTGNGIGVEGVAPGARLMPVKALDQDGGSVGNSVEDAIRFAADHGARVINVSIGVQLVQPVTGPGFEGAIEYAWSKGAVPVVAAGNNYNGSLLGSGYSPNTHAIVVAATDRNDHLATYSSGSNGARWGMAAPGGADPNFNPPGDMILSTYWFKGKTNQYAYDAGTSMAAPHVAGAVADLLALGLSPQQAVDRVLATAKKGLGAALGQGRLDVASAVGAPSTPAAPSPTTAIPGPGATSPSTGKSGDVPVATGPGPTTVLGTDPTPPAAVAAPAPAAVGPAEPSGAHAARRPSPRDDPARTWPAVIAVALLAGAMGVLGRRWARR